MASVQLPGLKISFTTGQYFRHKDGGYYQFEKSVYFADDQDELVIYKHVWPFEQSEWARRSHEFLASFTAISEEDFKKAYEEPKEVLQERISANRSARRNSTLAKLEK